MKLFKTKTAFLSIMVMGLSGLSHMTAHAAETAWKKVSFHETVGSREEKIISETYGKLPFFKKHPDVRLQSSVIRLDNGKNGSVAIKFISQGTCSLDNKCLTTVIWHDDDPASTGWKEVWTGKTSTLWLGPVSPNQFKWTMRELAGDDKVVWRWIGKDTYFPDLRSIATPWKPGTPANTSLTTFAKSEHPNYMGTSDKAYVEDRVVPIQGIITAHMLTYINMESCSEAGCPFILVMGDNLSNYTNIGEGIISDNGGTIPSVNNGYNTFVTQVGNTTLNFYGASKDGHYKRIKTVSSSGPSN